jgi:ATP synthase protein I
VVPWLDWGKGENYVARDFDAGGQALAVPDFEVVVTGGARPDEARQSGSEGMADFDKDDLDRRGKALDAALAARRPAGTDGEEKKNGTLQGVGNALKLSSEFIAAVIVGVGLGWFFDRFAGTSPWGLIVFLLLGFAAGVVNVLRASGQMAEFGAVKPRPGPDDRNEK